MDRPLWPFLQAVLSLAALALITAGYVWLSANPTTVALTYLLCIVLIATLWGIGLATVASVVAGVSIRSSTTS